MIGQHFNQMGSTDESYHEPRQVDMSVYHETDEGTYQIGNQHFVRPNRLDSINSRNQAFSQYRESIRSNISRMNRKSIAKLQMSVEGLLIPEVAKQAVIN